MAGIAAAPASIKIVRRGILMRAVVIRFGRPGDMLLLAPLLDRLHRGYGEPCLLLGTGPWGAALYDAHPDVTQVLQVNHGIGRWRSVRIAGACCAR